MIGPPAGAARRQLDLRRQVLPLGLPLRERARWAPQRPRLPPVPRALLSPGRPAGQNGPGGPGLFPGLQAQRRRSRPSRAGGAHVHALDRTPRPAAAGSGARRSAAGMPKPSQLRLVRHLPSRSGGRVPPPHPGRCCISLEGGNRGERQGAGSAQRLWGLVGARIAIGLGAPRRADHAGQRGWLAARRLAVAGASAKASWHGIAASRAAVHRTPWSASS